MKLYSLRIALEYYATLPDATLEFISAGPASSRLFFSPIDQGQTPRITFPKETQSPPLL
jgi:hypothetical protein